MMQKILLACFILILSACTTQQIQLDSSQHIEVLQQDKEKLVLSSMQGKTVSFSIEQALERAIEYNLDARVSALEVLAQSDQIDLARLGALPSLDLSFNYYSRSNTGASSSRSVLTGTQSLEPSFSTEQNRDTQDLAMNWNLLNILLAVSQTQNAKNETLIAAERHQKVLQNIQKDVYTAYWRALAAQETKQTTWHLLRQGKKHLQQLEHAAQKKLISRVIAQEKSQEIQEALTSLKELQNQTSLAELELKSLLSVPQGTNLRLTSKPNNHMKEIGALLRENILALEAEALRNRPEVRELILQKNISEQAVRDEILKTVPGAELFFALNRDSNQFLQESRWGNFTVSVTQNLMSLVTLPLRRRTAKNQKLIEDTRRQALTLAVMTQVHLSRQRLDYYRGIYKNRKKIQQGANFASFAASKKAGKGFDAQQNAFSKKISAHAKKVELYQSLTELQDAYAAMCNTLSRNVLTNP